MASYPAQLASESAQAYQAACAYFAMGADRSLVAVAQKLNKSTTIMGRWSGQHNWTDRARTYDAALAEEDAAQHTARYLADLEDHRKRASEAGKALYAVAGKLLQRMNTQAGTLELNANSLAVIKGALQTALDLEAHSLNLDKLLPSLTDDSE